MNEKTLDREEKVLESWCKLHEIDFQLALSLMHKIFPLLESAHSKKGNTFDRILLETKKGTDVRLRNSERILKVLRKTGRNKQSSEEVTALSLHLEFLPLFEGFFATQVNFLIFTLIANGHDFYSTRRGKYVKTLDEIEEPDLAFRLKFLKAHNFSELLKDEHNIRLLRNSTAHLFYEIMADGQIEIGEKKISKSDYSKYYDYLRNVSYAINDVQNLYYLKLMVSLSKEELEKISTSKIEKVLCSCGHENLIPEYRNALEEHFQCSKCGKPIV